MIAPTHIAFIETIVRPKDIVEVSNQAPDHFTKLPIARTRIA